MVLDKCEDLGPDCEQRKDECNQKKGYDFMSEKCPVYCSFCDPQAGTLTFHICYMSSILVDVMCKFYSMHVIVQK